MAETIAIIAAGEMGAATARELAENGIRVVTWLEGRSKATLRRARDAGMVLLDSADALVAAAQTVFSIVPPGDALALAQRLAPALGNAAAKPDYVDFNAVAPATAARIGSMLAGSGARYIDGAIIGAPPTPGYSPKYYVAGDSAKYLERLNAHGLIVRAIDGPIGAASALKMSYAGITKGLTALGAAMALGAERAGCMAALRQELGESQPQVLAWLSRALPRMYPKAYRWVAEMEEIAAFLDGVAGAPDIYAGSAALYEQLARIAASDRRPDDDLARLDRFCAPLGNALARNGA
ncbi:MAG: NAD(P)-dependent oxidoreductase [Proteobacteria bacterium]|nr:NAD(P)-dependent oxidoreductase [Pseudomonadota bacterium]